jgi:hypothetical protein
LPYCVKTIKLYLQRIYLLHDQRKID